LCFNLLQHWDLIALWEFSGRFAGYSPSGGAPYAFQGHGDQGLLNAVATLLNKQDDLHLLPQSTWCNSAGWTADETIDIVAENLPRLTVMNRRQQERQRLLHSTGPKWWTADGAEHFGKSGDVLRCFEHFSLVHRPPEIECGDPVLVFPGDLRYIGDISRQDAQILATSAGTARRILEFGVGGSTQILAQVAPPDATVITVETSPEWMQRTLENLQRFQIETHVEFLKYESWLTANVGLMDLVFVDGRDDLRAAFAVRAWRFLRVGGVLLIHDTRRRNDANYALEFAKRHYLEIESVVLNARASNITMITKKMSEPYVDWNRIDG
jgi:precorrin-6B methylase 2